MKKALLSLLVVISVTATTQASVFGLLGSTFRTIGGVVTGTFDMATETVGIVIPGVDREDREAMQCCCN